ncbi:MAG: hypothetical protein J6D27_06235 [Ruminiclostridium sp.]|nr:hypothetical protein [Ruminiclostridium sp.]
MSYTGKRKTVYVAISLLLTIAMIFGMFPVTASATMPSTADTPAATSPFPVDYDPNEGTVKYGYSGEIGMRPENDLNNMYDKGDKVVYFPDDVAKDKDTSGKLYFPNYNPSDPYYDYTDMFNHALGMSRERDNCAIFVNPGVYYFTGSVYLWGSTAINSIAGETAFVIKPNYKDKDGNSVDVNGFFVNGDLSETYAWYSSAKISDIVFVVENAHNSFKPTSSVKTIMSNLCSDNIQPVGEEFSLFYRIRTKYASIDNIAASGFGCFQRWCFMDMLTRVTNLTIGPTRLVYYGVQTNDAFFYDSYHYGGYYTDNDGLHQLPLFQINFSMGTTVFSNHYIGNYYFSRNGAGCWCPHTTYSDITFERVYNFVMDTTVTSNAVSGCLFKDGAYNDIAEYFEGQGLTPFDFWERYWDAEQKKFIYTSKGYIIRDTITGDKLSSANHAHDQNITMIQLHGGTAFTQNKIECDSLEWTTLVALSNSEWVASYSGKRVNGNNVYFSDNAFKIRDWDYANLMVDDWKGGRPFTEGWYDRTEIVWGERGWNNSDGTPAMGWVGKDGNKDVSWVTDDFIYVSPEFGRYVDMSAFRSPRTLTYGYSSQGKFGADEDALERAGIEDRCYYDLKSGKYEMKSFTKDFGGFSWNYSSNHEKLQEAFDYIASTDDTILYIESGEYRIDRPIVLRGGAEYRVIFEYGASIKTNKTNDVSGAGIFVMSADDNAPISGYITNLSLTMQSTNSSAFFNVNTDGLYINVVSIQRGVGCFTNCKLKNTIIQGGAIQYCDYGFFYKTVTDNTVVKNVYGTSSTWVETEDGITPGDINYRYFISNSDFAHSTWRGCWLEFGQFSNGKKLMGDGNSVYRGNIIDYTYNYSFGKNDMFVGNTMTRASYGSITNHMTTSNFPIDLPDALTNKPMVMFHINDGVKVIGNAVLGTMNRATLFACFDSPTIRHKNSSGAEVVSISNARVAGNLVTTAATGDYKVEEPFTPFGKANNVDVDSSKNNAFNFHALYFIDRADDPETPENETFKITKNEVLSWCIPGVRTYVNGEYIEVKDTARSSQVSDIKTPQPPQDEIYDVPNIWTDEIRKTEYLLYDFKDRTKQETDKLSKLFADSIDNTTIAAYLRSRFNVAVLPDSNGEKVSFDANKLKNYSYKQIYDILAQTLIYGVEKSPSGENSFFMDGSREGTGDKGDGTTNSADNKNKPTYSVVFRDNRITGEALQSVTASIYANYRYSYAWQGKRSTIFIMYEDADYYYGLSLGYADGTNGIFCAPCKIVKGYYEELGKLGEVHFQTGVYTENNYNRTKYIDPFSGISRPHSGEQTKTIMGDYTTIEMFGGSIFNYDTVILGVDFTCEYNDAYDTVSMYATVDFEKIGVDNSYKPGLKATTRKVWLGTYELNGKDKVFGLWAGDEMWVESVQFEYYPKKESTCKHSFTDKITRTGHCTKDAVVRHTCSKCGYEYEEMEAASGHVFFDKRSGDKILRTCRDCGFAYLTDEPFTYECQHSYNETVIQKLTCVTDGIVNYTCKYCGEEYTKNITATGHNYTVKVINPTAVDEGYTLHTCEKCGDNYKDNITAALGGLADSKTNIVTGIANGGKYYTEDTLTFVAIGANSSIKPVEKAERYVFSDWNVTPESGIEKSEGTNSFIVHVAGSYTLQVRFDKQVYKNGSWTATSDSETIKVSFTVEKRAVPPSQKPDGKPETNKPETNKPSSDKPGTSKPETDKPGTSKPESDKPDNPESKPEGSDTNSEDSDVSQDNQETNSGNSSSASPDGNGGNQTPTSDAESSESGEVSTDTGSDMTLLIVIIIAVVVVAVASVIIVKKVKSK